MIEKLSWVRQHPPAAARGFNRLYHTRFAGRLGYKDGKSIFDMDWDVCAILDACRYDYYERLMNQQDFTGDLKCRQSRASSTTEWLNINFSENIHSDTVYITGNPQYYIHSDDLFPTFHETIHVWQERWDEKLQTVHPSTMSEALTTAAKKYPNKRLLAHYVQPHIPFIGEVGKEKFPISTTETSGDNWNAARRFWPSIRRDEREYSREELVNAYRENLQLVVNSVIPTAKSLEGKVIITADHGQLLGERISPIPIREYAHPAGIYVPELINTPLYSLPYNSRRNVKDGSLESNNNKTDENVEKRLNALGYK